MYIFKIYAQLLIPIVFFIVAIVAPLPASAAGNNARCLINTAPSSVTTGQSFFAQVDVYNTGNTAWAYGAGYNLGSQSPPDNTRWGTNRVALPVPIPPGGAYGFSGNLTAPTTPGSYEFAWGMVQDGVEWFGTSCSRTITVSSPCTNMSGSASCSQYAGQYGIPSNYTVGTASYTYNSCTPSAITYTGGCSPPPPVNGSCSSTHYICNSGSRGDFLEYSDQWQWWCNGSNNGSNILCAEMKPCTQLTGTPVSCAQYAGQYGIPSNYTVGTASYTYNSCTNVPTYTGGCSSPPAPTASLTINGSKNLTIPVDTQYTWEWNSTNGASWSSSYTSNDPARCGSGQWVANTERGSDSNRVAPALAGCVFTVNYTATGPGGSVTDTAIATVPALAAPTASLTITDTTANSGISHDLTIPVDHSYVWNWNSTNGTSWSSSYTSNDPARCGSGQWVANTERGSDSNKVTSALAGCQFTVNYTVSGRGGTSVTDTVHVTVPSASAPTITSFTASPRGFSAGGGNVTLSWTTQNATSCTITGGGLNITRDPRTATSYTIPSRVTSTATYTLTCSGPGGTTTR